MYLFYGIFNLLNNKNIVHLFVCFIPVLCEQSGNNALTMCFSRNQLVPNPVLPTFTPSNKTPQCGVARSLVTPLIVGGETAADGHFPWLVAMFTATDTGYQYKCTANLVSNRHVVTGKFGNNVLTKWQFDSIAAARCVNFFKLQVVRTEDIVLVFGRSNLKGWITNGGVTRGASAVKAHPDFDANSGHGDIAVSHVYSVAIFK